MKFKCLFFVLLFAFLPFQELKSQEAFLGEVRMFAGNFAPRGWAFCDGQLLTIMNNEALFTVLGTTYGGDGRTTFALPDLRGRSPIHAGAGPGLSTFRLGNRGGTENILMRTINVPSSATKGTIQIDVPVGRTELNNRSPFVVINYIIALQGAYPSRG